MPSGAKKRKAAKKKKELEANNNNNSSSSSSNNPQEHYDAKSQDEKGSDGGEVSSPAHQDHHNNNDHPFNEGSEVKYSSAVRSVVVEDTKSMEKVPSAFVDKEVREGGQDDDVAKVQRGVSKLEEDSERSISIEGFEFSKISNDGDDKSSSSSSSSGSSSEDESQATGKKEEESEATKVAENESSGDANLVAQVSPIIESVKPVVPVSGETLSVIENAIVDNSLDSEVVKLETGAEKLANEVAETVTSFSPKKYEDKVFSLLDEYSKASPSELESESKVVEDKELPPSEHAHIAETTTGAECNKDSEKEPLIAATPAPCLVQRTSWLSCCGIFEVLSGSSR